MILRRIAMPLAALAALAIAPAAQAQEVVETPAPAKPFTADETAKYMSLGKMAIGYLFDAEADSFVAMLTESQAEQIGGVEGVFELLDQIAEVGGMPLDVLEEKVNRRNGRPQFWWEANFSEFTAEPVVFRFVFNDADKISGFGANPKSNSPPPDPEG